MDVRQGAELISQLIKPLSVSLLGKHSLEDDIRITISCSKQRRPADRIHEGEYGIQYLDYKVLAQILCETEPELVRKEQESH